MTADPRETLLVILGAGASHDCISTGSAHLREVVRGRRLLSLPGLPELTYGEALPPLTQNLVQPSPLTNWALDRWPRARPVIDLLQRSLTRGAQGSANVVTLEQALASYAAGSEGSRERQMHLLAMSFYLRDVLWASTTYMMSPLLTSGVTNHLTLVNRLLDWSREGPRHVVFVSFNYDLLLERAFESTWNFEPGRTASYLAHDTIHLLKPHGSIQWAWPMGSDRRPEVNTSALGAGNVAIVRNGSLDRSEVDSVLRPTFEDEGVALRHLQVPAMALPVAGKADFCWPAAQEQRFASLDGAVTRLLAIGWRGIEDHFVRRLPPIFSAGARALIVNGGTNGHEEADDAAWRLSETTALPRSKWKIFGGGFSGFLDDEETLGRWLDR